MTKKDTPTCEERLGLNLEINKSSNRREKTNKRDYQVGKSCHVSKNKYIYYYYPFHFFLSLIYSSSS